MSQTQKQLITEIHEMMQKTTENQGTMQLIVEMLRKMGGEGRDFELWIRS